MTARNAFFVILGFFCVGMAIGPARLHRTLPLARAASTDPPAYAANGDLLPPTNYREWIYLTSGIDMSYSPKAAAMDHSMFDNVFVNPAAYRSFLATGTWPDKTMHGARSAGGTKKGSINRPGTFRAPDLMDFEVHVKDETRFPANGLFSPSMRRTRTARRFRRARPAIPATARMPRSTRRSSSSIPRCCPLRLKSTR